MNGYDVLAVLIAAETTVRITERVLAYRRAQAAATRKAAADTKETT